VKTISLKKVSAVAVASLGFGLLSVVPAQADATPPIYISTATTVAGTALSATTLASGVSRTLSPVATDAVATITAPAGSAIVFTITSAAAFIATDIVDIQANGITYVRDTAVSAATSTAVTSWTTPTVAGTYNGNIRVYAGESGGPTLATPNNSSAGGVFDIAFTLTLTDLSAFSAGRTTLYYAEGTTTATADTTLLGASASKTVGTQVANILVDLNRADGTAYGAGTFYAYMTGPGLLDIAADDTDKNGDDNTSGSCTADCRSDSIASDANVNIQVVADGTGGVGTVNMYIVLADGVTKVTLPSRTVNFYGSVATLTVKQNMSIVKSAGSTTGYTGTAPGATDIVAVAITAKDSDGNVVCGAAPSAQSSDASVIALSTVTEDDGISDYSVGKCVSIGQITTGVNATSGQTATLTYRKLVSGVYVTAAPLTFKVASGTPKTVALTLDKATYAPGEKATLTVTMKDASGNLVSDGSHSAALDTWAASGSIQGLPSATAPVTINGVKTYTVYAPVIGGKFSINATLGTGVAAGATITSAEASVTDGNAGLLTQIDALNAKIVALNALIAKIMKKLGVK